MHLIQCLAKVSSLLELFENLVFLFWVFVLGLLQQISFHNGPIFGCVHLHITFTCSAGLTCV